MSTPSYLTPSAVLSELSSTQSAAFQAFYKNKVAPVVLRNIQDFRLQDNGIVRAVYDIDAGDAPPQFRGLLQLQLKTDFPEWGVSVHHNPTRHDTTSGRIMQDASFQLDFSGVK